MLSADVTYLNLRENRYLPWFLVVFLLRYARVVTNVFGNLKYRPTPRPQSPKHHASDITVVIPTTHLMSVTLYRVFTSVLRHPVPRLIISTAGPVAKEQIAIFKTLVQDQRVFILHRNVVSRREQTAQAMPHVKTSLLILQDDHTYWPAEPAFIDSIIAPFEDPSTGGVSAVLEARHREHPTSFSGFWNFLGMTYLARRRFEYCATSGIDGGISTLSGRFGVFRTEIYASKAFLMQYLNEYIFFGKVGPLNADDDKFHTRWLIDHGWKIKLQAGPESTMTTELGEWPKFNEQVLRWMRTTWRSKPRQLVHKMSWMRQPYTTFSLMMWFFRLSLVQEAAMFWLLRATLKEAGKLARFPVAALGLLVWIIAMKVVKILPHFRKHPRDLVYFPGYLVFGYWCTLVKIWAMLTCWNASWATAKVNEMAGATVMVASGAVEELGEPCRTTNLEPVVGPDSRIWTSFRRACKRRACNPAV